MQDGLVIAIGSPTDFRPPVCESIRNITTLLLGMFAHSSNSPPGMIAKFCGPLPRLGSMPISVNFPSSPMRYAAMLSCPRFVPYRKRPFGVIFRSGAMTGPFEVGRDRRDGLRFSQLSCLSVVVEHGDRIAEFVDDVDSLAVRMKRQMPRPGTGRRLRERRGVGGQLRRLRIQPIAEHLIEPQIRREDKPIVRTDDDAVRVRFLLPSAH